MPSEHAKHTATKRGNWVRVRMMNGEEFFDQFLDRMGHKDVLFKQRGRVAIARISKFTPITKSVAITKGLQLPSNAMSVKKSEADNQREREPERVEIKQVEKPVVPAFVPVSSPPPVAEKLVPQFTHYVNRLPNGGYILTIYTEDFISVVKAKAILGIATQEPLEEVKAKLPLESKDPASRVCSCCGVTYASRVRKDSKHGLYSCGADECRKHYFKEVGKINHQRKKSL